MGYIKRYNTQNTKGVKGVLKILKEEKTRLKWFFQYHWLKQSKIKELTVKINDLSNNTWNQSILDQNQPSKEVAQYLFTLIKSNPTLIASWMAMEFAKDLHKSNVKTFTFEQNCNVSDDKRVKITVLTTIEEIK